MIGNGRDVRVCPVCGSENMGHVVESGVKPSVKWYSRTRECLRCQNRWTSVEMDYEEAKRLEDVLILVRRAVDDYVREGARAV